MPRRLQATALGPHTVLSWDGASALPSGVLQVHQELWPSGLGDRQDPALKARDSLSLICHLPSLDSLLECLGKSVAIPSLLETHACSRPGSHWPEPRPLRCPLPSPTCPLCVFSPSHTPSLQLFHDTFWMAISYQLPSKLEALVPCPPGKYPGHHQFQLNGQSSLRNLVA